MIDGRHLLLGGFAVLMTATTAAGEPSEPQEAEGDRPRTRGRGRTVTTYIVLIVPVGTGDVYITGDDRSLGPWDAKGAKMYADGDRLTRNHFLRVGDQEVVTHVTAGFTGTP